MEWGSSVHRLTQGQVIAVDGKTLRRSRDRRAGKEAIHMVSAWASENSRVLGQTRTDAKSNEITAIPELLQQLDVSGCIDTIDAMGCQKEIARTILDRGPTICWRSRRTRGGCTRRSGTCWRGRRKLTTRECPTTTPPP